MAAADDAGLEVDYDKARERVYGMPYDQWKLKYQTSATDKSMAAFEKSKSE
jgi:hypothetical protein